MRRDRTREGWFVSFIVVMAVACAEPSNPPPVPDRLAIGTWGGGESGLLVSDTLAHVHVGCTKGNFPTPLSLDAHARFDVTGSYQLRAFPVAYGPEVPARLTGQLNGNRVSFTIVVDDTVTHQTVTLGPRTVRFGVEPAMAICPICRDPGMPRQDGWRLLATVDALVPGPHHTPAQQDHRR
ncbi:MAG: hypothetical protein U0132_13800 [Gemmatimonadaceae bacterium]